MIPVEPIKMFISRRTYEDVFQPYGYPESAFIITNDETLLKKTQDMKTERFIQQFMRFRETARELTRDPNPIKSINISHELYAALEQDFFDKRAPFGLDRDPREVPELRLFGVLLVKVRSPEELKANQW